MNISAIHGEVWHCTAWPNSKHWLKKTVFALVAEAYLYILGTSDATPSNLSILTFASHYLDLLIYIHHKCNSTNMYIYILNVIGGHTHVIFWDHWYPCFGFLVTVLRASKLEWVLPPSTHQTERAFI